MPVNDVLLHTYSMFVFFDINAFLVQDLVNCHLPSL